MILLNVKNAFASYYTEFSTDKNVGYDPNSWSWHINLFPALSL